MVHLGLVCCGCSWWLRLQLWLWWFPIYGFGWWVSKEPANAQVLVQPAPIPPVAFSAAAASRPPTAATAAWVHFFFLFCYTKPPLLPRRASTGGSARDAGEDVVGLSEHEPQAFHPNFEDVKDGNNYGGEKSLW